MTTTCCKYGTYEHAIPYRSSDNTWFRDDIWTAKPGSSTSYGEGHPHVDRMFAAGPDDNSPVWSVGHNEHWTYNSACSCCWLGFGHTQNNHFQSIERSATLTG